MDPMQGPQQLKQRTTVDSYITEYEAWMQVMKRGRNYLPDDLFVDRFLSGLSDNIKHLVHCQNPVSLLRAYWFARQYEKNHNTNILAMRRALPAQPVPPAQPRNAPPRNNPLRMGPPRDNPVRNARVTRQCWHCPEMNVLGHHCPNMIRAINALILQGHQEEEEANIH
jgi:hypothetical protein